ncbi:rubrerythrin-like domain-containing protein [Natrinema marinum]|nr:rubrerythrin-like domain-containing protein [Natrinema marinum]
MVEEKHPDNLYECIRCGRRVKAHHTTACSNCGGEMQNLSNVRE